MVNEMLHDVHGYEESTLKTRNRLIEAVWQVIVGNDTPEPEDGQMLKQPYVQTKYGPGSIYNFIYKGKQEAALTEVQRVPGEFSYFLQSDREMIGEVMEQVTELAAGEEKAGRVCAQCGKEIDPVKDGFELDAVAEVTKKRGTTEVEFLGYDEEWEINIYRCKKCGYATIFEGNNFCAKCGAEINWELQRLEEQRQREQRKKNGYRPGVYAVIKDTQV